MSALFLSADLMFSSKVQGAATRQGVEVKTASSVSALMQQAAEGPSRLVILDLTTPALEPRQVVEQLRGLAAAPAAIIAYAPHVHEAKLAAAIEAGCDEVFSRGQFNARLDAILAKYLG